jgi:hypothetical protein
VLSLGFIRYLVSLIPNGADFSVKILLTAVRDDIDSIPKMLN